MAEITAKMVSDLRERTGAGMMDCKKALVETQGDFGKAEEFLRKKGIASAAKKAGRVAAEGLVGTYVHNGKIGVLIEVNCETDFVARNEAFQALVKDLAMHIAATKPKALNADGVNPADIAAERSVAEQKAAESGKPAEIVAKMVEGSVQKFLKEVTLLSQPFVKNDKQSVEQMLKEKGASISKFVLFVVGEGIEKKTSDFAAEVAAAAAGRA